MYNNIDPNTPTPTTTVSTGGNSSGLGLISGGAQLIGGLVTDHFNRKYSERMTREQWAEDERRWHQTNLYNSPAEQMRRLKEAGLNPALMYEGKSVPAGNMPQAKRPEGKFTPPKMDMLERYMLIKKMEADIANTHADTKATITGEKYTGTKIEGQQDQNRITKIKADLTETYAKDQLIAQLGLTNAKRKNEQVREALIKAQTELKENEANLTKIGLNNSDNVVLRYLAQRGANNPVEASQLILYMSEIWK